MDSPFVAVACVGLAIWGLTLLLSGFIGRDVQSRPFLYDANNEMYDGENRWHPPERHRGRQMATGAGLVLVGLVGVVAWGAAFY